MYLHELKSPRGARKRRKMVGRGRGSGHGKTCGRGHKGQRARSGRGIIRGYEGGQMTLFRRLPKIGFRSHRPKVYQIVRVNQLNALPKDTVVDGPLLKEHGLIQSLLRPYKILSDGEIKKVLTVRAFQFSKAARDKIEKAGGKAEVIECGEMRQIWEQTGKHKT